MVLPVIAILVGGLALTGYFFYPKPSNNVERIIQDFAGLDYDLHHKLHGQHLVRNAVSAHIKAHFMKQDPSKALVLSFHGSTGVGKNFVSQIIAKNMYRDGMKSSCVHFISATNEFPHRNSTEDYKVQLKSWTEKGVKNCERAMFIFDEVDTIPATLLDVLRPFVEHTESLNGVDYRKAIFIFLSNIGGTEILNLTLTRWLAGKKREELTLKELEKIIWNLTLNAEDHGLRHSKLITQHLITAYIPFLPLEREHVKLCIKDELERLEPSRRPKNYNEEDIIKEIMEEMTFYPPNAKIYSVSGCKRVAEKTDYVLDEQERKEKSLSK